MINSHVMKTILQTLTWFTLCSKELDVNPGAGLEVNRGEENSNNHS